MIITFLRIVLFCFLILFLNVHSYSVIGSRSSKDVANKGKPQTGLLKKKCDPCPTNIRCVPQIQCPAHVRMKSHERPQACDLPSGKHGFCCITGRNHTVKSNSKISIKQLRSDPNLMHDIIEEAKLKLSEILHQQAHAIHRGHPEFLHNIMFRSSPRDVIKMYDLSNKAMEQLFASQIYKEKEHVPIEDFQLNTLAVELEGSPLGHSCPVIPNCLDLKSKYRSPDGSCNNPDPLKSLWGSARQPMERLLPPSYEDGIWEPRKKSIQGKPLPNARTISRILLTDEHRPHSRYNLLVMQFGQLLAHDITQSSSITLNNGDAVQCCTEDGAKILAREQSHYACMAIPVEPGDEFYETYNQGCINFVRLSLSPHYDCRIGYGKQLSKVTHYLDGSAIYGSDIATQNDIRSFTGGKLRMFDDYGRDLLPLTRDQGACESIDPGNLCFLAGDVRTNQIVSLTALHVLFAREHNRIADTLSKLNPHLPDETVFQETRRIVVAELQHITYSEWLPLIIGTEAMRRFNLETKPIGYSNDYDPQVNAAITNEFSGAAFRFGHSIVDGKYKIHRDNNVEEIIEIPDVMFNPTRLRQRNFLDNILKTMTEQPMQEVDNSITWGLSRFLFRGGNPFGLDLAALNVQRGRDQGLRSYNDYLEVMGHHRVQSFSEFPPEISTKLSSVYSHPDDIDLWIGGLLEPAAGDALVGRTFSEIISDQFSNFRKGDRYFYDNDPAVNPGYFSLEQLQEIRKTSMARIICDNADHYTLNSIQSFAFLRPDIVGNSPKPCESDSILNLNFDAWKEQ